MNSYYVHVTNEFVSLGITTSWWSQNVKNKRGVVISAHEVLWLENLPAEYYQYVDVMAFQCKNVEQT